MSSHTLYRAFVTASVAAISLALQPAGFAQTAAVSENLPTADFGYAYDTSGVTGTPDNSLSENEKWQNFGILSSLTLLGYASSGTRTPVQRFRGTRFIVGSSAVAASLLSGDFSTGDSQEPSSDGTARHKRNGMSIISHPDGTTLFSLGLGMAEAISGRRGRMPGQTAGSGSSANASSASSQRAAGLNTGSSTNLAPLAEPGFVSFAAVFGAALARLVLVRKSRRRVA